MHSSTWPLDEEVTMALLPFVSRWQNKECLYLRPVVDVFSCLLLPKPPRPIKRGIYGSDDIISHIPGRRTIQLAMSEVLPVITY